MLSTTSFQEEVCHCDGTESLGVMRTSDALLIVVPFSFLFVWYDISSSILPQTIGQVPTSCLPLLSIIPETAPPVKQLKNPISLFMGHPAPTQRQYE